MLAFAILVSVFAFASCMGWGITLALVSRNQLREANALEMQMKVRKLMDDDASAILERYKALLAAKNAKQDGRQTTVLTEEEEARREAMRQGLSFVDTMPDDNIPSLGDLPLSE